MEEFGDSLLMDMDLFMDMDMHGTDDLFPPNLDLFGGSFQSFDTL